MEYQTQIDIANRACQHCGARRIDPALGFTEVSRQASEISSCFGKLRRAELRRNAWRFATRRAVMRAIDTTTMLLQPALWVAGTTYFVGSIVIDQSNNLWISRIPNNLGNDPQNTLVWEPYFGPLSVSLYTSTAAYYAGELVYTASGAGANRIYLSLQNGNSDNPATATAYDATATYMKNQVVTSGGIPYMSVIDLNTGQNPATTSHAAWSSSTTYAISNQVTGSDGIIYTSVGSGNIGFDPVSDGGVHWTSSGVPNPWTTVFVGGTGSLKWLQIGGTEFPNGVGLTSLNIVYPLGTGPSSNGNLRNIYRMPSGYLGPAAQNPKPGISWLGGPSGIMYNDWLFEGDFLVTSDVGPIPYRFIADVTDVRAMDDMFCEGLAARIGMEVCEPLTQSNAKLGTIAKIYDEWMSTARAKNAIEIGPEDPPDDEYVSVRL